MGVSALTIPKIVKSLKVQYQASFVTFLVTRMSGEKARKIIKRMDFDSNFYC